MFRKTVNYYVTNANVAPHHFKPGTAVKFVRASRYTDWFLFRGKNEGDEHSIIQWLAKEDVSTVKRSS